MTLKDNETSCCMSCSCADDCAEINGDCCPDKALPIKKAPLAKCKAVVVKRKLGDTSSYDGYTHGVPRYRVIDTCPKDENNVSLVAECEGNKTRLDHFLWVSDFSGRTFENRFCALCNGLNNDEIVVWGLRTMCFSVLKTNLSSLEGTLLSLQCDFRLELPSKAYARPDSICLTPNILRCNQSGLWNQHNSSIEAACKTYDSPVLSFSQDERRSPTGHIVKIYKNLYCVVCNEQNLRSTNLLCPQLRPTERDPGTAFSILIDYLHIRSVIEQLQTKDEEKGHCEQGQVYDDFKDMYQLQFTQDQCLKLYCPYCPSCRKTASDLQKVVVHRRYKLATDLSNGRREALDLLGEKVVGQAIVNSFRMKSGAQRKKYFSCRVLIYMSGNKATEFHLSIKFYTTPICHLETLFDLRTDILGKTLKVKYGKALRFNLYVAEIAKRSSFTHVYSYLEQWCGSHNTLNKETICPEVSMNSSEIAAMEQTYLHTPLRVTESGVNDTVRVCWDDYTSVMSKIYKSASYVS